jgi:hypothetical protein
VGLEAGLEVPAPGGGEWARTLDMIITGSNNRRTPLVGRTVDYLTLHPARVLDSFETMDGPLKIKNVEK